MKKRYLYKVLFGALLLAGIMTSCSEDEWGNDVSYPQGGKMSLSISPSVFGLDKSDTRSTTETQEEAQSAVNYEESTIHTLDVYLIGADNNVFLAKRIDGGQDGIKNDGTQEYIVAEECHAAGVEDNKTYTVYASVNSSLTADDVTAMVGKTINDLKALNTEDPNIFRRYATADEISEWKTTHGNPQDYQIPFTTDKKFLMDYITTWNSGTSLKKVITMTNSSGLKRAAAKIVFNMEFSKSFKRILYGQNVTMEETAAYTDKTSTSRYIITGEPRVRYVNFAFNTTDFTDGTYDQEIGKEVKTGSLIFMTDKEKGSDDEGGRDNIYGHTTYSFANTWTADTRVDDAPYIMVSLPFQQQERDNANAAWVNKGNVQYNYYRIPICQEDVLELKRNNLYMVKAVINSFGSSSPVDEDQEVDLFYEIMDWKVQDPVKMEAKLFNYLKVIPQTVYIYGNGELSIDIQYFINSNSSLKHTTTTGNIINIPAEKITYKDANGVATQVNESGNTTKAEDIGNGTIRITSKSLANHAVKDFTFTVELSNDATKTAVVTVKHIPTDNIQNIQGAWSSKYGESDGFGRWVDWDKDQGERRKNGGEIIVADSRFNAKVTDGTTNYGIYNGDGWGEPYGIYRGNSQYAANQNNSHMYVIQIGSTSADYVLGNPTIDPVTHFSQDKVAAPAFMIASQLAIANSFPSAQTAATHCTEYVEVTKKTLGDGTNLRKIYSDWRLPTASEIGVIVKYQDENIDSRVIYQVLIGTRYWALDGTEVNVLTGTTAQTGTRCVRTMTADDLKFLNDQMSDEELKNYMETY